MLGTGKSFRTARDADAVRAGSERAVLSRRGALRAGSVNLACTIEAGQSRNAQELHRQCEPRSLRELPRAGSAS